MILVVLVLIACAICAVLGWTFGYDSGWQDGHSYGLDSALLKLSTADKLMEQWKKRALEAESILTQYASKLSGIQKILAEAKK